MMMHDKIFALQNQVEENLHCKQGVTARWRTCFIATRCGHKKSNVYNRYAISACTKWTFYVFGLSKRCIISTEPGFESGTAVSAVCAFKN